LANRPNILIVCTDQQHWRMNSVNGHPLVRTPNLERLAERGVNFRRCYANSPVCVPARASLMSGLYPSDVGAYDNAAPFDGRRPTFANAARDVGYYCTATGKLDMCSGVDYGFEEVDTKHGHDVSPDITAFFRNPICVKSAPTQETVLREGPPGDRRFLENTLAFLRERSQHLDRSWLAWTGWNAPHNAYRTSQQMLDLYPADCVDLPEMPEGWESFEHPVMRFSRYHRGLTPAFDEATVRLYRSAYYGMITEIDSMVGELLDELDRTGQLEETVVVFTSDHGDMMGEHGLFQKNAPYDGCARVPLIMAGPGLPEGRTVEEPVSLVDLCATMVDLAGADPLPEARGCSLVPLAWGSGEGPAYVYVELNTERLITGVFTVVRGGWKYNEHVDYPDQLFNLAGDPDEWRNRVDDPECAGVLRRLRTLLRSIVDPEQVNDEAFADQDRRLKKLLDGRSFEKATADEEFFGHFSRRLGQEQARQLLRRHFQLRESIT